MYVDLFKLWKTCALLILSLKKTNIMYKVEA